MQHHRGLLSLLHWLAAFELVDNRNSTNKIFSQNSEDGILLHLFKGIGVGAGSSFGAHSGSTRGGTYVEMGTQDGSECNTRNLRTNHAWSGLMLDGGYSIPSINLQQAFITVDNVVSLMSEKGWPPEKELDMLSIDLDCFDFWLTRNVLAKGYRPRMLVNEVNSAVQLAPPGNAVSVPHPADERTKRFWATGMNGATGQYTGTCWSAAGGVSSFMGASVGAFWELYRQYNYSMVYCDNMGINCYGVRNDLLPAPVSDFLTAPMVYRRPQLTNKHCGTYGPAKHAGMKYVEVCDPSCESNGGKLVPAPSW